MEVGAYDGFRYSNSLLLKNLLGSRVICIEPSPQSAAKCRANRPDSRVWELAAHRELGLVTLVGDSPVSVVDEFGDEEYLALWGLGVAERHTCFSAPLRTVLDIEKVRYVDVLSIDVQGAELSVLQGVDWAVPIGCICIELDGHNSSKDDECRTILEREGFVLERSSSVNEFWINASYARRSVIYSESASRPTRFLPLFEEKSFELGG